MLPPLRGAVHGTREKVPGLRDARFRIGIF
jgi:hypothetical protein